MDCAVRRNKSCMRVMLWRPPSDPVLRALAALDQSREDDASPAAAESSAETAGARARRERAATRERAG